MLDDAAFDVEGWLAGEIATEFARAEGAAFVNGDGINKPRGFLTGMPTDEPDGERAFGTLQYLATGNAGGFPASSPQGQVDRPDPEPADAVPAVPFLAELIISLQEMICWIVTEAGWRFVLAPEGTSAWLKGEQVWAVRESGGWVTGQVRATRLSVNGQQVIGSRGDAVASPVGGTMVDEEA